MVRGIGDRNKRIIENNSFYEYIYCITPEKSRKRIVCVDNDAYQEQL